MQRFGKAVGLVLVSSLAWAFWTILIDLVDASGKANFVSYVTITGIGVVLLGLLALFLARRFNGNRTKRVRWTKEYIAYATVAGVLFGAGTLVFYSLLGGVDYPFVTSMQMAAIIPFAFIIGIVTKQRLGRNYFLGTVIAFAGFVLEAAGLYGSDFSASYSIVVYSAAVMVMYTVAYFFQFKYIYKGLDPVEGIALSAPAILVTYLAYGEIAGSFSTIGAVTVYQLLLCALTAVAVIIAWVTEIYAFRIERKAATWKLNVLNILTEFEIVWAILFTVFYLSISLPSVIGGLFLVFFGMLVVSTS